MDLIQCETINQNDEPVTLGANYVLVSNDIVLANIVFNKSTTFSNFYKDLNKIIPWTNGFIVENPEVRIYSRWDGQSFF